MSDASPTASPVEAVNAEIRAYLLPRRGRPLWPAERAVYEALLARWEEAVRGGLGTAA